MSHVTLQVKDGKITVSKRGEVTHTLTNSIGRPRYYEGICSNNKLIVSYFNGGKMTKVPFNVPLLGDVPTQGKLDIFGNGAQSCASHTELGFVRLYKSTGDVFGYILGSPCHVTTKDVTGIEFDADGVRDIQLTHLPVNGEVRVAFSKTGEFDCQLKPNEEPLDDSVLIIIMTCGV